jgi:omega-6 fatty acid desaturase (delta-12 desaturase)
MEVSMRTGSELNIAVKPFQEEDRGKSWRLLATTLGVLIGALVAIPLLPSGGAWMALKVALGVLVGLVQIRFFIFYHDYLHGAIFHDSKLASAVMSVCGFYLLAVRSVWKETHNYHHKNNAKLIGSSIGSFPVVTVGMWNAMTPLQRRLYRFLRHPITIFTGYFTVFLIGMTLSPFKRDPKSHWGGPLAVLIHLGLLVTVGLTLGWSTALCMVFLPSFLALGLGSYLFFVQHNFPAMKLKDRRNWDYTFAALKSSSMFDMSPLMHWFTGNIGYHHIHHLNHRIPFYRLPEAMAAVPELQAPGRTSWRLSDIASCLSLAVWDPDKDRMLTYDELDSTVTEQPVAA